MIELIRTNTSKIIVFLLAIVALAGVAVMLSPEAVYADAKTDACEAIGGSGGANCTVGGPAINTTVENIIDLLSAIIGAVAVIMIVVGGFKYVTSGGDSSSTKSARDTIIYAVVGLVVVAIAQAIVWLVLSRV